ncbi:ATP-binding protein [Sporosarcina sp. G11-34]|uniref:ATP-binding protein n=1 Tax=Sporosarcina sp. G11-34 TaxID=2849605 RepID=UPI0022A9BDD6|nr:ATP-binding protein [Sporosarcina sp. G11-34]MCZ2258141.1 response regulator [Sporosarcina sp. G11-34]
MYRRLCNGVCSLFLLLVLVILTAPNEAKGHESEALILLPSTESENLYPAIKMFTDKEKGLTIEDVSSDSYADKFAPSELMVQKGGFFDTVTWIRFEIKNQSNQNEWLLELAFPLIYEIMIYGEDDSGIVEMKKAGSNYPFEQREIKNRQFVFNLDIEPEKLKTYYIRVRGSGDLHPPINIWSSESFIEKTQMEFSLLGLFYGAILVMILYNLFLYFSLRIKSYLYYVFVITATLMGQLSTNGLAFQYLWPNSPSWNIMSTPFWVSLACIFILIFARSFLDTDQYSSKFKLISYLLMILNGIVICTLFISPIVALNMMLLSTISTFFTVLSVAFVCLKRGARQARFFIVGWVIFLIGVLLTIFERATLIPYSIAMDYAGQVTLAIEVILLSLALADKINIMRTEKEQAEQEAIASQALAMESLKKTDELKDEFLAITSHELRTPLYGIIGIAESLRDGVTGDIPTEMGEQLSIIITSGNRLTHLINDILDFSKLKHDSLDIHLKPVYLSGIVDVIFTICRPLVQNKPIRLINTIDNSLPAVVADQNRLQQIFYNLIGNAIKYTEAGEVIVSAEHNGNLIKVSVSDTGKGITKENQEIIFEPFEQGNASLSRDVGGAGIGLSITKWLVGLHGGRIEVESKVGEGSIFSFMLPIQNFNEIVDEVAVDTEPSIEEEFVLSTPNIALTKKSVKVLVADDEPVNLQVLMNQLTLEGYEVITASNGEEVLRIVAEQSIELLILDIMLPKMSGYEVCQRLRKNYSLMELPILMLTAKSQVHDKITSFEVGANDYLTKPCDKEELLSRVKTLIRLRSLNQELIAMNLELEEKVMERTKELEIANDDLTTMNEDLMTMAKSRRQLLANIAHELGTPVTLIHSYVQALQQGLVAADDTYYSNLVFDKIKVLSRLISDLSDLSNLEAGRTSLNVTHMNLGRWLDQIYNKFEFDVLQFGKVPQVPNGTISLDHYSCSIDIERMDQVFSNLVRNAVKYTPTVDGIISIKADLNEAEDQVVIQVKDNGDGIREENLPLIFERFYKDSRPSTEDKENGTGLGLTIVKEIVQSHKGTIAVESKVGTGSSFYISLPVQRKINRK